MEHKINHLSTVEKELSVVFSGTEVSQNFTDSFKKIATTTKINGFRQGKVPMNVVKSMYGKKVAEDVESFLLGSGINTSVIKENLHVITDPEIVTKDTIEENKDFTFTFKVQVFPELKVNKDVTAEYVPVEYKDEMLEEELKAIAQKYSEYTENGEKAAEDNDRLTLTFAGKVDGEEVPETKGENHPYVLGSKRFVEDFEKSLYGKKQGDTYDVDVNFPETYHGKNIAGKTVTFTISVNKLEVPAPFELNDDFLKSKPEFPDTVEELRVDLENKIKEYLDNLNNDNKKYIATEKLVENNTGIEIPPVFLNAQIEAVREQYKKNEKKTETNEEDEKKIRESAEWTSKRFLLLSQLAKDFGVRVSETDVDELLAKEAAMYGIPAEYMRKILNENMISEKKVMIQEDKVLNKLLETAVFTSSKED